MRHCLSILGISLLGDLASKAMASEGITPTSPMCDVAVESALCLHNNEKIVMPDARPYGMEVHLTFDESRPLDASGKKNHASGEIMAAAGIGGSGSSALFRNNFVYVPSSESFKSADYSYTFFVYLLEDAKSRMVNDMHDQFCPILHKGVMQENVQEASPALLVNPKDGRVKVVLGTTGVATAGAELQSNSRLRPHQWYHMALVRHLNRVRLYVDGILDSSMITEGATKTNDLPLFIGGAPYAENVCDMPMMIDEFRMFSSALGRDHIQAEASLALGGIEPSFIHIGCTNCNKDEAAESCPDGHHLCDKLELYTGGFHVARKLSLGTSIVAAGSAHPARGLGLCCSDA